VGAENFYLFGLTTPEVEDLLSRQAYDPWDHHAAHPEIRRVLDALSAGRFTPSDPGAFHWLHDKLLSPNERYLHLADFMPYVRTKDAMFQDFADKRAWTATSILNTARMGYFSSDRTIAQYARDIWDIHPVPPGSDGESGT
jgi:starch phosphorylase